jgi:acetyl-CoA carboxylase beta subunit
LNFGEEKKRESSTVDVTKKEELFHIPCPNGHELEVPREMLEQTALCPHCNSQFKLRERDSVEAKRKKVIREEQQERQTSNTWLHWIVGISVAVLLFLLALVFLWSG